MKNTLHSAWFYFTACLVVAVSLFGCRPATVQSIHEWNGAYAGDHLNRLSFPLGGIGAGMFCMDGNGSFSSVSLRSHPDVNNRPFMFAAVSVKGNPGWSRIVEGPVPSHRIYGNTNSGNGGDLFGCPRFTKASFLARFPFGTVTLSDKEMPIEVTVEAWSPFIPGDADHSSLPVAMAEYTLHNHSSQDLETVFSFHAANFMRIELPSEWGGTFVGSDSIMPVDRGFILHQSGLAEHKEYEGSFAVFSDEPDIVTDHCWFRGGWFDSRTLLWKNISESKTVDNPPSSGASGASVYIPAVLGKGKSKTIRIYFAWYVPFSSLRIGSTPDIPEQSCSETGNCKGSANPLCCTKPEPFYKPWYAGRFRSITEVTDYWKRQSGFLRKESKCFSETFFSSTLPGEVLEAVSANLSILKSPTVLRQTDGRLWAWEGCHDQSGCCNGSCTHVWNYAQAIPHLFPQLERTLRETEFLVSQNAEGHQNFRSHLPIRIPDHNFYAAADGQLGGIIKAYREWRISGNTGWLKDLWPAICQSLNYCIAEWDPRETGTLEEPHHNTYDIEFWGPDALCTGFYLGALAAAVEMGNALEADVEKYAMLFSRGKAAMEGKLYNGEYFMQQVMYQNLRTSDPVKLAGISIGTSYSPEALALLREEGPKYQYGNGCLSDGVFGCWLAKVSGLPDILDHTKIKSHLSSVYRYNFKPDLTAHVNPQRAGFAYGAEGGLILCSWPKGDQPTLPFVYSNEVWTGIEYQVASHLMMNNLVNEGLDIVKACRDRYNGIIRNPFNEYECGHWYARALSSYGLLQGLTGIRYDAVDRILLIDSKIGRDFQCFLATESGYGLAGLRRGRPFIEIIRGDIPVVKANVSGQTMEPEITRSENGPAHTL